MAKPSPKPFVVTANRQISKHMRRLTLSGSAIEQYPEDAEGGYVKLVFPGRDTDKPLLRTYTIANLNHAGNWMDLDFVIHEDGGPASLWAANATTGDTIDIGGPGPAKPLDLTADWILIAGDMTALPAIRANLRTLPEDARGYLILEITNEADKEALDIDLNQLPSRLEIQWLINSHPGIGTMFSDALLALEWLDGKPAIWVAGELNEVLKARAHLKTMPNITKGRMYISSYWQYGMTEDRHKVEKKRRL